MNRTAAHIRPYRPGDLDALYQICLLTGDGGQDATSLFADPMLLGHFFAAPYGLFAPSLAFVLEDGQGVGGYILGALDTRAFTGTYPRGTALSWDGSSPRQIRHLDHP